jgi:hypothetical protein
MSKFKEVDLHACCRYVLKLKKEMCQVFDLEPLTWFSLDILAAACQGLQGLVIGVLDFGHSCESSILIHNVIIKIGDWGQVPHRPNKPCVPGCPEQPFCLNFE